MIVQPRRTADSGLAQVLGDFAIRALAASRGGVLRGMRPSVMQVRPRAQRLLPAGDSVNLSLFAATARALRSNGWFGLLARAVAGPQTKATRVRAKENGMFVQLSNRVE